MLRVALIGGTGMGDLLDGEFTEVATPFGSAFLIEQGDLYFLSRHGRGHKLPPHKINYRANIWALREVGVQAAIATFAVGSLRQSLPVGTLVVLDDFLDFTTARPKTFFDDKVQHTDMTQPYSHLVREELLAAGEDLGIMLEARGCYVCTDGPRYETLSEVRMFAALGGDVVGMTGVPEVVLAKEIGIEYGALAMVTNLGAGLSKEPLSHQEVARQVVEMQQTVQKLLQKTLEKLSSR